MSEVAVISPQLLEEQLVPLRGILRAIWVRRTVQDADLVAIRNWYFLVCTNLGFEHTINDLDLCWRQFWWYSIPLEMRKFFSGPGPGAEPLPAALGVDTIALLSASIVVTSIIRLQSEDDVVRKGGKLFDDHIESLNLNPYALEYPRGE